MLLLLLPTRSRITYVQQLLLVALRSSRIIHTAVERISFPIGRNKVLYVRFTFLNANTFLPSQPNCITFLAGWRNELFLINVRFSESPAILLHCRLTMEPLPVTINITLIINSITYRSMTQQTTYNDPLWENFRVRLYIICNANNRVFVPRRLVQR